MRCWSWSWFIAMADSSNNDSTGTARDESWRVLLDSRRETHS